MPPKATRLFDRTKRAVTPAPSPKPAAMPRPPGGAARRMFGGTAPEPTKPTAAARPSGNAADRMFRDSAGGPQESVAPARPYGAGSPAAQTAKQTGVQVSFRQNLPRIVRSIFKLPNGVTVNHVKLEGFADILENARRRIDADSRSAPDALKKAGDQLLEMHAHELRASLNDYGRQHVQEWEKKRNDWLKEFREDPAIGRNRQSTTMDRAKAVMTAYGKAKGVKRLDGLSAALRESWFDGNPEMLHFVDWVGDLLAHQHRRNAA